MSTNILAKLQTLNPGRSHGSLYPATEERAWASQTCPHCDAAQMLVVATTVMVQNASMPDLDPQGPSWLLCTVCRKASVVNQGVVQPHSRPLRTPAGLPADDETIWEEVRSCLGIGAYAATVMLCRKLLFHTAVNNGLPEKKENGRAPTYMEAVKHLEAMGVVTAVMRTWVDKIKNVGNDANHELTPITPQQAVDVATFTQQLLVLAYEMEALMAEPTVEVEHLPDETVD